MDPADITPNNRVMTESESECQMRLVDWIESRLWNHINKLANCRDRNLPWPVLSISFSFTITMAWQGTRVDS